MYIVVSVNWLEMLIEVPVNWTNNELKAACCWQIHSFIETEMWGTGTFQHDCDIEKESCEKNRPRREQSKQSSRLGKLFE